MSKNNQKPTLGVYMNSKGRIHSKQDEVEEMLNWVVDNKGEEQGSLNVFEKENQALVNEKYIELQKEEIKQLNNLLEEAIDVIYFYASECNWHNPEKSRQFLKKNKGEKRMNLSKYTPLAIKSWNDLVNNGSPSIPNPADYVFGYKMACRDMEQEISRLKKALKFYASGLEDPRKIDDDTDFVEGSGELFGKRAREALNGESDE